MPICGLLSHFVIAKIGDKQMTLDTYSHVAPGLQEAAANRFDELVVHRCEKVAAANVD